VFLFSASALVAQLTGRGAKLGIATSVASEYWDEAEVYPLQRCSALVVSQAQREQLALFASGSASR
jgi:hypothetical protein